MLFLLCYQHMLLIFNKTNHFLPLNVVSLKSFSSQYVDQLIGLIIWCRKDYLLILLLTMTQASSVRSFLSSCIGPKSLKFLVTCKAVIIDITYYGRNCTIFVQNIRIYLSTCFMISDSFLLWTFLLWTHTCLCIFILYLLWFSWGIFVS